MCPSQIKSKSDEPDPSYSKNIHFVGSSSPSSPSTSCDKSVHRALRSKIVFVNYFCVHGYSVSLVNVSCLNKTDWSLCFDFTEPACTIWLYITTRSLWNSWYRSEAFYSLWSKSKIVHEVIHYVINTMETASLSRAACPPHSLHNVIFITDERKIIQGRSGS